MFKFKKPYFNQLAVFIMQLPLVIGQYLGIELLNNIYHIIQFLLKRPGNSGM